MSGGWRGSDRRRRLPADWRKRRTLVLDRDGWRCTEIEDGARCPRPADEVDHIVPNDDHRLANLRGICRLHHREKSAREGWEASPRPPARARPAEPHPGLFPPPDASFDEHHQADEPCARDASG